MNYEQALQYLFEQLPMYQRSGAVAYKNNLDNTLLLDQLFKHPHLNFKTIHVAGTNGKGSVSHMLASVLQSAGYKVGLYTSPHLKDYRERIRINGEMIPKESVCNFLDRLKELTKGNILEPSFFELSVAMAFDYFSEQNIDIAVVEVGLGGRLDSTNIISPEISIITNISLDHVQLLGNTLELIAGEKAGIIKPNIPVIIGEKQKETQAVFEGKATQQKTSLLYADQEYEAFISDKGQYTISKNNIAIYQNIDFELKGFYQKKNILTAIAALEVLKNKGYSISSESVFNGLKHISQQTGLQGRWQQIGDQPKIVCDSGHNEAGIKWVTEQLKKEKYKKLHIVYGAVNDKDIRHIISHLPKEATYYFTRAKIDRAFDQNKLKNLAIAFNLKGESYPTVREALLAAKTNANANDLIFVGGSTFIVAEVV